MKLISLFFFFIFCYNHGCAQHDQVYQLDKKLDYSIMTAAGALTVADLLLSKKLDPLTNEQILNLNREEIWSIDRKATEQYSLKAKDLSDVIEIGVLFVPSALMFSKNMRKERQEIFVMYVETFSMNLLTTHLVKLSTKRTRPFVYNPDVDTNLKMGKNSRRSFYSGHTSHTSALSIYTAKVFSDFYPDSKWKPAVWLTAISIPSITGYLRYKAGQHFPTDIAVGGLIGGCIGYFIPELHKVKSKMPEGLNLTGTLGGVSLTYSY